MSNIGRSDLPVIHNDCMSTKITSLMGNVIYQIKHNITIALLVKWTQ